MTKTHYSDPERQPVIVGVGQINDRPESGTDGLDSIGLMAEALRRAAQDANASHWLDDIDSLATVAQISFPTEQDQTETLAAQLGIQPAKLFTTPKANGDSPIRLLDIAAGQIADGSSRICAVVGAEALRTMGQLMRQALAEGRELPFKPLEEIAANAAPGLQQRYGLVAPVNVYPLYENATRAEWKQTLDQAQSETGQIWSRMAQVAAETEGAWIRRGASAEEVCTPSPSNRPIAFPYNKLMVANSSVNQGAGFIVTSLAEARRRNVPEERLIHVGHGAGAREPEDILSRDSYAASPSMKVVLEKALEKNCLKPSDLDYVELYSCFPCIPKMARRLIDWPTTKPATVFGGLTFGGGPIGNYMSHAVVEMVHTLREKGDHGLLFANGGYATHNHALVLSRKPAPQIDVPRDFDVQADAEALRGRAPELQEEMTGGAVLETYTVFYDREGLPKRAAIIARDPTSTKRTLAAVTIAQPDLLTRLTTSQEPLVGLTGHIESDAEGLQHWSFELPRENRTVT